MKVAIDTDSLVAALLGKQDAAARKVIELVFKEAITPLVGDALFNEYMDVINRAGIAKKCPFSDEERMESLAAFISGCQWQKIYFGWRPNLKDEGDNHVIELAVAGGAKYVITLNIRDLKGGELIFDGLKIVTPQQFIGESLWV